MASDSFPPANLKEIANEVAALLKERKETVAVAETVCLLRSRRYHHDRSINELGSDIWLRQLAVSSRLRFSQLPVHHHSTRAVLPYTHSNLVSPLLAGLKP